MPSCTTLNSVCMCPFILNFRVYSYQAVKNFLINP